MPISAKLMQWLKGFLVEAFILAAAVVGVLVLLRAGSGHVELSIALWAFVALAGVTVVNVMIKHRLWVLPFIASLVALIAPLACLERLHEPSQTPAAAGAAVPLATVVLVALAAGACMLGSLISGRMSGQ